MNKKVRKMLDRIDAFLAKPGKESEELWDILTALRGPDDQDNVVKEATTAVIRWQAFPRTARVRTVPAVFNGDTESFADSRNRWSASSFHFWRHAGFAFAALGLKWSKINRRRKAAK